MALDRTASQQAETGRGWSTEITGDMTHKAVLLIACPELYIREALRQLAQDRTHQVASSGWSIIGNLHPED